MQQKINKIHFEHKLLVIICNKYFNSAHKHCCNIICQVYHCLNKV